MADPVRPRFCVLLKESIRPVALRFCNENPGFEDLIHSYCAEMDQHSPQNVTKYLNVLFKKINERRSLDSKNTFFSDVISKEARKNADKGKKISTRTVIEEYKAAYIPFAMKYIQRKYDEKTLSRAQIYEEEVMHYSMKESYLYELNEEFAEAHPAEMKLLEEHGVKLKRPLRALRFCNLLKNFRRDNPQFQQGLCLLVKAARAIGENSEPQPSTRCVLQFLFLPLSQLPPSSREVSAVPSPPPRARCLLGHRMAEGRTGLRRMAETFSLPLSQLV
jgi:hypothetical protein